MSHPQGVEVGTRASSLVQCGCGALLDLDVCLSSATVGVHLSAVVIATMPCGKCGKTSQAIVQVREELT